MSGPLGLDWRGPRRSLARVVALFAVTAGAYWPLWLAQILPAVGDRSRRARIALVAGMLIPGINVLLEIVLALLLPRAVRDRAERSGEAATETEAQTFLLLAAPSAAIAIALALGLPAWLVGYLAWPLELPAAIVVQRTLNRLEPSAHPPRQRRDGELVASGVIAAVIVAGVALAIVLGGDEQGKRDHLGVTRQVDTVSDVAVTPGAVWVTRILDNAVEQIDTASLRPTGRRVGVGRSPFDIAAGYGSLWVADYRSDSVSRVDPAAVRLSGGLIPTGRGPFGVAVGFGRVWVTNTVDRNLVEIDPRRNKVRRKVTVGAAPRGVAVGEGAVWVAGAGSSSVVRVDPRSGGTKRIPMPALCQDVAVGGGSVWAVLPQANAVVRIDPARARKMAGGLIPVGLGPASIEYGAGSIWVANSGDGTVTRIDARTGKVRGKPIVVGKQLSDLTVSGREVWVLRTDGIVRRISAG